jgi:carboxyl-terminal processing protease
MSPNNRSLIFLAIGIAAGAAISIGGAVLAERESSSPDSLPWADVRLLAEVLERVKQDYVEPVNDHRLIENAIRGMVTNLDPHSQFLNAQEYEEVRISTTGNYSGVGLEVNVRDGRITVVAPLEGGSAAQAGVHAGDVIQTIDGAKVDDHNVSDAIARLRGRPGTHVKITVSREGTAKPLAFDLLRGNVQVHSVRAQMLEPGIAYLRISSFSETTAADLRKGLAGLRNSQKGVLKGLVLDVRNNPGGVLDAAVDVSDEFLDSGVIVTASGRGREANFRHEARPGDLMEGAPIVVLVNGGSASASEILAGALQDNKRATILGAQTFGKGSVQTVMPLSDGEALKLTTSKYFTPSGKSINGQGIKPDVLSSQAVTDELNASSGDASFAIDVDVRAAIELLRGPGHAAATPTAQAGH